MSCELFEPLCFAPCFPGIEAFADQKTAIKGKVDNGKHVGKAALIRQEEAARQHLKEALRQIGRKK